MGAHPHAFLLVGEITQTPLIGLILSPGCVPFWHRFRFSGLSPASSDYLFAAVLPQHSYSGFCRYHTWLSDGLASPAWPADILHTMLVYAVFLILTLQRREQQCDYLNYPHDGLTSTFG